MPQSLLNSDMILLYYIFNDLNFKAVISPFLKLIVLKNNLFILTGHSHIVARIRLSLSNLMLSFDKSQFRSKFIILFTITRLKNVYVLSMLIVNFSQHT